MAYKPERDLPKKKALYEKMKAEGKCVCCFKSSDGYVYCKDCREKKDIKRKNRINNNLCWVCGKKALEDVAVCYEHWFWYITKRFPDIKNIYGKKFLGKILKIKFESQKGRCFYTGGKFILGKNASVDHKISKKNNGTNNVDNLIFVDRVINQMKTSMNHEEFIEMCKFISKRF